MASPSTDMLTCRLVASETVFGSTHTTLQHSKVYQARLLPCKINLTSSPGFDGRAGEPGVEHLAVSTVVCYKYIRHYGVKITTYE